MAGRRADIGIVQVKRRGFTFDLICLARGVADERSDPFSVANGRHHRPPSPAGRERQPRASERRTEDDNTVRPCGITPTGQKQSASNQRGSFFRQVPRAPRHHEDRTDAEPGYPLVGSRGLCLWMAHPLSRGRKRPREGESNEQPSVGKAVSRDNRVSEAARASSSTLISTLDLAATPLTP